MDKLVDVVPAHIRFSRAKGAPVTRNVIVRNISAAELPLQIDTLGHPFQITHGAEHVGKPIRLSCGEQLPLQVTLNRAALFPDGKPICDFLIIRIELCRPVQIDLVVTAEGMAEDAVRRFVDECRPCAPIQFATDPIQGESTSAVPTSYIGGGSNSGNVPRDVPSVLAAFLGEAPTGAALRRGHSSHSNSDTGRMMGDIATNMHNRGRRMDQVVQHGADRYACDSPADSPEPSGFDAPIDFVAGDDDRPPTPVPFGFENCILDSKGPQRRDVECTMQELGLTDLPPKPLPKSLASTGHVQCTQGTKFVSPRPSRATEIAPGNSCVGHTTLQMTRPMQPFLLEPQPGGFVREDGCFFLDGVGWCDEYGRAMGSSGGSINSGGSIKAGFSTKTFCSSQSQNRTRSIPRKPHTKSKPLAPRSGSVPPKIKTSDRQLQDNWDAIGGI